MRIRKRTPTAPPAAAPPSRSKPQPSPAKAADSPKTWREKRPTAYSNAAGMLFRELLELLDIPQKQLGEILYGEFWRVIYRKTHGEGLHGGQLGRLLLVVNWQLKNPDQSILDRPLSEWRKEIKELGLGEKKRSIKALTKTRSKLAAFHSRETGNETARARISPKAASGGRGLPGKSKTGADGEILRADSWEAADSWDDDDS